MFLPWERTNFLRDDETEGSGGGEPAPRRENKPPPREESRSEDTSRPSRQQETLADVRAEAASYRVRLRETREELNAAIAARDEAVAARERAVAKAGEEASKPLQTRLEKAQRRVMDTSLQSALVAAGLADPDLIGLVSKLPDAPKIEVDDDFNVKGVEETVAAFKKWKPEFFKTSAKSGEQGTTEDGGKKPAPKTTSGGGEPSETGEVPITDVRKMTKPQYEAFKAEQMRKLRGLPQRAA